MPRDCSRASFSSTVLILTPTSSSLSCRSTNMRPSRRPTPVAPAPPTRFHTHCASARDRTATPRNPITPGQPWPACRPPAPPHPRPCPPHRQTAGPSFSSRFCVRQMQHSTLPNTSTYRSRPSSSIRPSNGARLVAVDLEQRRVAHHRRPGRALRRLGHPPSACPASFTSASCLEPPCLLRRDPLHPLLVRVLGLPAQPAGGVAAVEETPAVNPVGPRHLVLRPLLGRPPVWCSASRGLACSVLALSVPGDRRANIDDASCRPWLAPPARELV